MSGNKKMQEFGPKVREKLDYYVYRLIDPRNGETFYVGKGKGNRVFAHAQGIKEEVLDENLDELSVKLGRINDIKVAGFEVEHIIHRHGMNEKTAFEVEAALIDAYAGLTNEQGGHSSDDRGVMHVRQIIEKYAAKETPLDKHKLVMISVNRSVGVDKAEVYEAVRYCWRLDGKRAAKADYVLAMQQGLVIGVFVADQWLPATKDFPDKPFDVKGRWGFIGREAPADIQKLYMRTRLPDELRKKGASNPIRYSGYGK